MRESKGRNMNSKWRNRNSKWRRGCGCGSPLLPSAAARPCVRPHGGALRLGVLRWLCLYSPACTALPAGICLPANPSPAPWAGFLNRLGSVPISPQLSCEIPALGPGRWELLCVPYCLSPELSPIWICSLPCSLPVSGPPAPSHFIETLRMANCRAVPCPWHHHAPICLQALQEEIFRNQRDVCSHCSWGMFGEPRG